MEIRSYEGDGQDVARLIQKVWATNYAGKTWVPAWELETLRWQILSPRSAEARDYLLAVYDGTRLMGCFFADPRTFTVRGEPVRGSLMSWFTVDPDAGAPLLAIQLTQEMLRRHRAHQAVLSIGYVMGKANSPAYRFWSRYAERFPEEFRFLRKVGYWVRVLDPAAVSRSGLTRLERWGAPWLRMWQPTWPFTPHATTVRAFQPEDLSACLDLVNRPAHQVDLGLNWSETRLQQQLESSEVSESLVCEASSRVVGLLNFHRLVLHGREPLRCGLMDVMAGPRSLAQSSMLLRAGLARMREAGLQAAVMLQTAGCPAGALLANGFLPLPAQDHLVSLFPTPWPGVLPTRRFSILLR